MIWELLGEPRCKLERSKRPRFLPAVVGNAVPDVLAQETRMADAIQLLKIAIADPTLVRELFPHLDGGVPREQLLLERIPIRLRRKRIVEAKVVPDYD
jgi:hypothetical protein